MRHPSLELVTSPVTLRQRAQLFSRRCLFFRVLHLSILMSRYPASFLFWTHDQLIQPPLKSSILPLKKIPVFQGDAPWNANINSSAPSCLVFQHQLTHPPVRRSAFPLRDMSVSQGVLLVKKFSNYPFLAPFDLVLTYITHWQRIPPCISGLFL